MSCDRLSDIKSVARCNIKKKKDQQTTSKWDNYRREKLGEDESLLH